MWYKRRRSLWRSLTNGVDMSEVITLFLRELFPRGGRYYKRNSDGFAKDRESLRGDVSVLSSDMRVALKKVKSNERQQANCSEGQ